MGAKKKLPQLKPRRWTAIELDILREWYGKERVADTAKRLNRSMGSVTKQAGVLKLTASIAAHAARIDAPTNFARQPVTDPGFDTVTRLAVCARWQR